MSRVVYSRSKKFTHFHHNRPASFHLLLLCGLWALGGHIDPITPFELWCHMAERVPFLKGLQKNTEVPGRFAASVRPLGELGYAELVPLTPEQKIKVRELVGVRPGRNYNRGWLLTDAGLAEVLLVQHIMKRTK